MPAPYDYGSSSGYSKAREDWISYPSTSTPVRQSDLDRWDQAIYDLKRQTFNVNDYGAVGDGVTDDSAAFNSAITAANAAAVAAGNIPATVSLITGTRYRIASTLTMKTSVRIEGDGASLIGPITGSAPINAGNNPAVPAASNVAGQTAGACFSDAGTVGSVIRPAFRNLELYGFRYGMVSVVDSWAHPIFENIFWNGCNIGFFAYQGSQEPRLLNATSGGAGAGTSFVAAATCYASGNPYTGLDNFYCDGLIYDNSGYFRDDSETNATFDTWFEAAILRPGTGSVTIAGTRTFPFTGDTRSVSGRNVYVPDRNNRGIYSMWIRRAISQDCDRGVVCVGTPIGCLFDNIGGESMFASGPHGLVVVLQNTNGIVTSSFRNINGTDTTNPGYAIEVIDAGTVAGRFVGSAIKGTVVGAATQFVQLGPSATRKTYTVTNVITDRTYDANSTTTDELADVVGTLIADLRDQGILL